MTTGQVEIDQIIKLLQKLSQLPVDVSVLQETGIGKCVNGLKKQFPELAVHVKPLVQSWKSLVQTAMQVEAEQRVSDSAREESSTTSESSDDRAKNRPHSKPRPRLVLPERDLVKSRSCGESPTSGGEGDGSGSSPERQAKEKRRLAKMRSHERKVPPTPVPWSPEQKVFPPYIPKKERSDEDDSRPQSIDSSSHREERCNGPTEVKTGSGKGRTPSSKSVQSLEDLDSDSHSTVHVKDKHDASTPNRTYLSKSLNKESSSRQSSTKPKLEGRNILLNNAKSSRVTKDTKDHTTVHSHSESKKRASKVIPLEDDPSSLFQPDVASLMKKHSPGTDRDKKVEVSGKVRKGIREDSSPFREKKEISKSSSSSQSRDKTKPTKEHQNHSRHLIDERESAVKSPSLEASKKLSSTSGKVDRKSKEGKSQKVRTKPPKVLEGIKESNMPRTSKSSSSGVAEVTEITFESTGLSFGDCLFGGSAPVPKRLKVAHTNKVQITAKHDGKSVKSSRSPGVKDRSRDKDNRESKEDHRADKPKKRKSTSEGDNAKAKKYQTAEAEASASDVEMSLPDIHPDYKPTPKLPELKPQERKRDVLNMQWLGSKQTKTKVYSGKARKKHWDTLPSLQDICKEVIFDNIEALFDTGGVPFYLLEDVLEKCTPQQLLRIEDYNPDYILESDHLWKKHTGRCFNGSQLGEMESWRELYLRKSDEREYKLLAITANISAAMAKKDTGRLTKMAFVDKPVKPPRNVIRQQMRHGTASSSTPAKAPQPRKALPVVHSEQTSHRVIPEREVVAPVKKRTAKVVAPMMRKSLKLMKKVNSRR